MASCELQSNGLYRARWREDGRKCSDERRFTTARAALNHGRDKEADYRAGRSGPGTTITWAEWEPAWTKAWPASRVTKDIARYNIDKHIRPHWGPVRLDKITAFDIQAWVTELHEGLELAPSTVEKIATTFSGSLKWAVANRLIPVTPYVGITLPDKTEGKEFYFTVEQFWRVFDVLEQPYRLAVCILAFTGMRFGEMASLHWQSIDREARQVEILTAWAPATGDHLGEIMPYTKGRRRRHVPLLDELLAELPPTPPGRGCGQAHAKHGAACRSPLVLTTPLSGEPLDAHNVRRVWYGALERAGLTRATLHDLRHTYASWMLQGGMSLDEIAKLLGHSDSRMAQRYSHFATGRLNERVFAAAVAMDLGRPGTKIITPAAVPLRPAARPTPRTLGPNLDQDHQSRGSETA